MQVFQELATSGILQQRGGKYFVDETLLAFGFGLLLVDQIEQAIAENRDLREVIAEWMEPHAEIEIKSAIYEFAAIHLLGIADFTKETKAILLHTWISSHNPQEDIEDQFAAYLPTDPDSYISLAEIVWSDTYNLPWAQDILLRAFLQWSSLRHVVEALQTAFERWLGFIHIDGFIIDHRDTEKALTTQAEIKQRIGIDLQALGPFSCAGYPFTAIQDDGLLRLGRTALAIISSLPRNRFIHAIVIGCVAEAIMGRPDKYDLFAWTIRTSLESVWSEIANETSQLLKNNSLVCQQAAYRLLSFEGSQEAFNQRNNLPKGIFTPNPFYELYQKDPCTSGFSWRVEDCETCLQRDDLAIDLVARQISPFCINPDISVPDRYKSQFDSLTGKIDPNTLWSVLMTTEADLTLQRFEPVLNACAPHAIAAFIRETTHQLTTRKAMARRQLSISLSEYHLLFGPEEWDIVHQTWSHLITESDAWEEADKTAELFLFPLVLISSNSKSQLESLFLRPVQAVDLASYESCFTPITDWQIVRKAFTGATNAGVLSLTQILWFISAHPTSIPHDILKTHVTPLLDHDDGLIRSLVLKIVLGADDAECSATVIQSGWAFSQKHTPYENQWGCFVLCRYSQGVPFAELCKRIHPAYLGYALNIRDRKEDEVTIAAEIINRVWLSLDTITQDLPVDMPKYVVDTDISGTGDHFSRVHIAENALTESVTYRSPNASWGGIGKSAIDPTMLNTESLMARETMLMDILRGAIDQQKAAGNAWFQEWTQPEYLGVIVEQCPDLVARWVNAALDRGPGGARYTRKTGTFYTALCIALLEKSQESGIGLYQRLQEDNSRVHMVDSLTEMDRLDFALFDALSNDTFKEAWVGKIRKCTDDQELLKTAVYSQFGQAKTWLLAWVEESINSPVVFERARAITLLGFLDNQKAQNLIQQLSQSLPDTWLGELVKKSKQRWDRNAWAKHWFRRFLSHEDSVEAWASFRLFLKCVDSRLWLWWNEVNEYAVQIGINTRRRMFVYSNFDDIHRSIKDNEKEMSELFLGQKIVKGEIWPWLP